MAWAASCTSSPSNPLQVPTAVGLGLGLSLLTAFLCFTLKLFSKARTVQTRCARAGYCGAGDHLGFLAARTKP